MAPIIPLLPYIAMAGATAYSVSEANKNKPKPPSMVTQPGKPVSGQDTQGARDDVLRRLAKIRAANTSVSREKALSPPNVQRKVLGAGI